MNVFMGTLRDIATRDGARRARHRGAGKQPFYPDRQACHGRLSLLNDSVIANCSV